MTVLCSKNNRFCLSLFPVCALVYTHATFQEGGDLEKQKLRQTRKAREWDELMSTKKKMKVLEPVVRGCIWEGEGPAVEHFQCYAVCLIEPLPKADTSPSPEELSHKSQREEQCECVTLMTVVQHLQLFNLTETDGIAVSLVLNHVQSHAGIFVTCSATSNH